LYQAEQASSNPLAGQVDLQLAFAVVTSLMLGSILNSMRVPHKLLSPAALRAVVDEFVTRDGTDHSSVEQRIENVMRQLDTGRVELHFDGRTETCNILPVEENPREGDGSERDER